MAKFMENYGIQRSFSLCHFMHQFATDCDVSGLCSREGIRLPARFNMNIEIFEIKCGLKTDIKLVKVGFDGGALIVRKFHQIPSLKYHPLLDYVSESVVEYQIMRATNLSLCHEAERRKFSRYPCQGFESKFLPRERCIGSVDNVCA